MTIRFIISPRAGLDCFRASLFRRFHRRLRMISPLRSYSYGVWLSHIENQRWHLES
ncbi:MAG: hypothetical protein LBT05_07415 [Planctomycetaceae bacterium]|jgi:hypothetical protein|nr:hypothetical protein [Planctomycetaceae bacterium]